MSESTLLAIVRGLALVALSCGAGGMAFTMLFLWSSNMADLVGAGFPFVGSAVLLGCGLITLALTLRLGAAPPPTAERRQLAEAADRLADARRQLDAARERVEFEERVASATVRRSE